MEENKNKPTNAVSFKDTLNLPRTDFPIRANAKVDDPAMIARWEQEKLYAKSFDCNKGNPKFILHDGPPYSNGHIHLGHAFNKVRKDIVTKSQRMLGKHVPIIPGWDCHGLPIELKVSKEHPGVTRQELKKECRAYANGWIDIQRKEFKDLAVVMDWDNPYRTMDFSYEAAILKAFSIFVQHDFIERKNKTVPWCFSCQTVLALSEIEYEDRKDPSLYVRFPLTAASLKKVLPTLTDRPVSLVIWTTTPWTLPLNRAVMVRPGASYVVLDAGDHGYLLVGAELADKFCALFEMPKKIVQELTAADIVGLFAQHPFDEGREVPIIADQSVTLDEGTAFVHCAPGCGPQDYEAGVREGLEIFSPLGADGRYTEGIQPAELQGMIITDAQIWVIKKLAEKGVLLAKKSITHPYPHCWRCHNGLMFRATKQWFCDLEKNNLRDRVLKSIEPLHMLPENSKNRLIAGLEGRLEWCLSRQRVWGVPIPALLCEHCDFAYCTPELVQSVAAQVAKKGIEYWDDVTVAELVKDDFVCPGCGSGTWKKEMDILDVWFESGVSHFAVLYGNEKQAFPADMYLEGKDQHRAWFQSSLLTSMVLEEMACMKSILTHGFTVDEQGRKMSKSLGNVVAPQELVDKIGTDGLRLWAATIDYASEVVMSETLLRNVSEVYRKIRNTARFLLSNLYDFDINRDAVALDNMRAIDRYALDQLVSYNNKIVQSYRDYDFTAVFQALANYCSSDLSAFYLDIIKDRLYVEKADGHERRSAQTACWYILDTLTRLMAPILSITAEQITDHYQKDKKESVHLAPFASLDAISKQLKLDESSWQLVKDVREALLKAIEQKREIGMIKHPLEARITMHLQLNHEKTVLLDNFLTMLEKTGQTAEDFIKEFLIVSQVTFAKTNDGLAESIMPGLFVDVLTARGVKCPRCWQWEESSNEHGLCSRCQRVIKQ